MKVAQLLYSGLGGHGSVVFSLLDADKSHAWQSSLGFLGIEPVLPAYAEACQIHGYSFEHFLAVRGKPWRTWPRIARWLNKSLPDAIILHGPNALFACLWHARRRRVPLIVVEHQNNGLKSKSAWVYSHLAMLLADYIVLLTPAYDQEMRLQLGFFYRSSKVRIVPNGIDTTRYAPVVRPVMPLKSIRLGMAARFIGTKRQDVLVMMMNELHHLMPDIEWQLSLAGTGETWSNVERLIYTEGVKSNTVLPGQLDEPKLIHWYQSLDIYLHASEGETLSTSLLQAMASGLPIVASDVPGIRNLLNANPVCGILIRNQNPKEFAKAVAELVKNPDHAESLAKTGRQIAVSAYSQNQMFAAYTKIVENNRC
jgi:glycosyltransferase involved in cell wall biosynthesis